jgi:hypothetical protein
LGKPRTLSSGAWTTKTNVSANQHWLGRPCSDTHLQLRFGPDMIHDSSPITNEFLSVPPDLGQLNCAAFIAGIISGILAGAEFVSASLKPTLRPWLTHVGCARAARARFCAQHRRGHGGQDRVLDQVRSGGHGARGRDGSMIEDHAGACLFAYATLCAAPVFFKPIYSNHTFHHGAFCLQQLPVQSGFLIEVAFTSVLLAAVATSTLEV